MPADARSIRRAGGEPYIAMGVLRTFMNTGGMDAAATEQARTVPTRAAGRGVADSTRRTPDCLHCNDHRASHADSSNSGARATTVQERRRHEAAVTPPPRTRLRARVRTRLRARARVHVRVHVHVHVRVHARVRALTPIPAPTVATEIPLMLNRFTGLLRDAWYLLLVIVVAAVAIWFLIDPLPGIVVVILGLVTFAYFAIVRYDDDGHDSNG